MHHGKDVNESFDIDVLAENWVEHLALPEKDSLNLYRMYTSGRSAEAVKVIVCCVHGCTFLRLIY